MPKRSKTRTYDNALREARAEETRQRILGAVGEVLASGGITSLTMPAVAKAAKVSLPTVYRYFPDKGALVDAAAERIRERIGVPMREDLSLKRVVETMRRVGERLAEETAGYKVLVASHDEVQYDPEEYASRRERLDRGLREDLEGIRGKDRAFFVDVTMVLASTVTFRAFERFGFDREATGDRVEWMLETLLLGIRARKDARARERNGS